MEKKELEVGDKVRILSKKWLPEKYDGKTGVIDEVIENEEHVQGYKVRVDGKSLNGVALRDNLELIEMPKSGTLLISEERDRQIFEEGYTDKDDDVQTGESLACAAAVYATPTTKRGPNFIRYMWPYSSKYYKPTEDRIRELVKAGALIAAEIDRLQRKEYAYNKRLEELDEEYKNMQTK